MQTAEHTKQQRGAVADGEQGHVECNFFKAMEKKR
jgi:hypothetical protein